MTFRTAAFVVLAATSLSLSARAGAAVEIPHTINGTLAAGSTPATVSAMLVTARWHHLNPDKEHSTWESMWLEFGASGNVDITTMYANGPRVVKAQWHVVAAGNAPSIDIGGVAYTLAPCKLAPRVTCLTGPRPPLS